MHHLPAHITTDLQCPCPRVISTDGISIVAPYILKDLFEIMERTLKYIAFQCPLLFQLDQETPTSKQALYHISTIEVIHAVGPHHTLLNLCHRPICCTMEVAVPHKVFIHLIDLETRSQYQGEKGAVR